MLGPESLTIPADALMTVGFVFVEAIVLYVVYGLLNTVLASKLLAIVGGD